MSELENLLAVKDSLRLLDDWTIIVRQGARGEVKWNVIDKTAVVFLPERRPLPRRFFEHELLHVALQATRSRKQSERHARQEILIQDICRWLGDNKKEQGVI